MSGAWDRSSTSAADVHLACPGSVSAWKNAATCIGIRTQPWEVTSGIGVPVDREDGADENTGLYISPSGTVTRPGMKERVVKSPVGVMALPQPFGEQK